MDFKTKLARLIDVKTVVTFTVIAVFAYLATTGKITPENVMVVVSMIITFFFAKKDTNDTEVK